MTRRTCLVATAAAAAALCAAPAAAFAPSFLTAPRAHRAAASPLRMAAEPASKIRIGTRGSPLALAQAYLTRKLLGETFPEEFGADGAGVQICVIKTTGDMVLDKALAEIGGKGLFTKELDVALMGDEVDICVHSMKDVPTWLVDGTVLPCTLEREDTRDAFISEKYKTVEEMPAGCVIGSASLRRQAQLMATNPGLKVVNFRGNIQTRLRKVDEGVVDATMLAIAGLNRMGISDVATKVLDFDEMLPAVSQGAIGIQCRADDEVSLKYLAGLNHQPTKICVDCERAFLAALDGNCRTPIAGQAKINADGNVDFRGLMALPDGTKLYETSRSGTQAEAIQMGTDAGMELKERAGPAFFETMLKYEQEEAPKKETF